MAGSTIPQRLQVEGVSRINKSTFNKNIAHMLWYNMAL